MRFFFTQQQVQKLPKSCDGKPRDIKKIGVDGIDGYMGNAIAWLALEAGYGSSATCRSRSSPTAAPKKLAAKYERAVKKGKLSADDVAKKVGSVEIAAENLAALAILRSGHRGAHGESRRSRPSSSARWGSRQRRARIVASNSSSMGPGMLSAYFAETGGDAADFVNLHFFSPAEHPMMQLVEIIRGKRTSDDAVATAHAFVRKIGKTPLLLNDGSAGFLVNAGLAAYFQAAEELYREGTPIATIDAAIRKRRAADGTVRAR